MLCDTFPVHIFCQAEVIKSHPRWPQQDRMSGVACLSTPSRKLLTSPTLDREHFSDFNKQIWPCGVGLPVGVAV